MFLEQKLNKLTRKCRENDKTSNKIHAQGLRQALHEPAGVTLPPVVFYVYYTCDWQIWIREME